MNDARVRLWGSDIGAVTWQEDRGHAVFQYTPDFAQSGIQLSPLVMPLSDAPYSFPELAPNSFHGLPGLLSDSLPDKFGNALIDLWLARQARAAGDLNPVERLCYIGTRGMGGLEFEPGLPASRSRASRPLEIEAMVDLANQVLSARTDFNGALKGEDDHETIEEILRIGTSAGGARAKAIVAWNPETSEFRSGQVAAGTGFSYWLMKFDGVSNNRDKELADPQGFGMMEYAFARMAIDAGLNMSECRLHREGGRSHFMTRRFDRTEDGDKLHMQSLGGLRHFDFNLAGAYSYEQAVETLRMLDRPQGEIEEQFRRAVFNILIRNQDDHVKNIAYLMDPDGEWCLSPAYDVGYAYNPSGDWTSRHQMSLNGKRDDFDRDDLTAFGGFCGLKPRAAARQIARLSDAVSAWPSYAEEAGVFGKDIGLIHNALRLDLAPRA